MSNPAKYLAEFFERDAKDMNGEPFSRLYLATLRIDEELEALAKANVQTKPFASLTDEIRAAIGSVAGDTLGPLRVQNERTRYGSCQLDPRSISLLLLLAEKIDLADFATEDAVSQIGYLLAELKKATTEDESLDPQLRLFIARAILAVEKELDEFQLTGDFNLKDALLHLIGLMRVAETVSSQPARWTTVWESWGIPIVQGLIVSIPQLALGMGQLFPPIEK